MDSSGYFVASSYSYNNPYEMVEFVPATTGNYFVIVARNRNNDIASKIDLAVSVTWE